MSESIEALVALGWTPIEALAYAGLLEHPRSTGYGLAHRIGKPTANTYKALASLEDRGAVTVEDDARRHYSAVAPEELLDGMERRFREHRTQAVRGLSRLAPAREDGVHQLRTIDQAVSRLRRMLGRCRTTALLELPASVLDQVADDIALAGDGGADVRLKTPQVVDLESITRVVAGENTGVVAAVVDGREMLLAALTSRGTLRHGVWSARPDVAGLAHRALIAEILFADVDRGLEQGMSIDDLEEMFGSYSDLRRLAGDDAGGAG